LLLTKKERKNTDDDEQSDATSYTCLVLID